MNVPNILSIFRMLLVPCFVFSFFSGTPQAMLNSAGIYALAGVTDILDGIIARRFNLITKLGKILDPLADKLMTITVFICITIRGIIPWWVLLLIFFKDILQIIGGVKLYHEISSVFSANYAGKATTVVLVLGGIIMMIFEDANPPVAKYIFIAIAAVMSLFEFSTYLYQYMQFKKTHDTSKL